MSGACDTVKLKKRALKTSKDNVPFHDKRRVRSFLMTLLLNTVKCNQVMPSTIFRWYHKSQSLCKWPSTLEQFKSKNKEKKVKIWNGMTIWELAKSLRKDLGYMNEVLKPALDNKIDNSSGKIKDFCSIQKFLKNENLHYEVISANTKNVKTEKKKKELKILESSASSENEVKRPPVVTIMGHVDHGKTTLLDALRNSNIVAKEFGGITQHIGAFSVTVAPGKTVTFIDTPGHAAFSAMRSRGAEATDIVVLIVAADDGVMEQTTESINMARNAGVRIIVAVNKIDKVGNTMVLELISDGQIKEQLLKEGIQAEDLGGDVQFVPISALKRINLDLLIEAILTEAEIMALTGDPTSLVQGIIIESSVGQRGKVATMIVKRGTLRKRAILVAGGAFARVRAMYDEDGRELLQATLSQPAQIIGWQELPSAGEKVVEVKSQREANMLVRQYNKEVLQQKMLKNYASIQEKAVKERADFTEKKRELIQLRSDGNIEELKKFFAVKRMGEKVDEDNTPKLNIIVKGDVDGSVDAILDILDTYKYDEECKLNLVHYGVGEVTQSDLDMAITFDAIIYCFNLNFPFGLKSEITSKGITLKFHNIIYKFIEDLKVELSQRIREVEEDEICGTGEVLQNFFINERRKEVPVAGSTCNSGEFRAKANYRIIRDGETIFEGPVQKLKHFKTEVNSVKKGSQCGIMLQGFTDEFKPGDKIICFEKKLVRYQSSWNPGF